jgi:biopolymer transport protein ExbD
MFLNKEPITLKNLRSQVKAGLGRAPELTVILNADGAVHHRAVVEVMDELRLAGVAHLAIAVQPEEKVPRERRSP